MASQNHSPQEILSEAFTRRAEAYRRWRNAAELESSPSLKTIYQELAALECDRFEELAVRFYRSQEPPGRIPSLSRSSAMTRPGWEPPLGSRTALRAAADAAESERRTWADLLRGTGDQAPERGILLALLEDARRVRDLIGGSERGDA